MQLRYVLPVEMITGPYDSADEASIASVSMEIVAGPSSKDDNIIENGVIIMLLLLVQMMGERTNILKIPYFFSFLFLKASLTFAT